VAPFTGSIGKGFEKFANSHGLVKHILPFIRTSGNITKNILKSTPAAYAFKNDVQSVLKNGTLVEKQRIHAQMAIGSSFLLWTIGQVRNGYFTGGSGGTISAKNNGRLPYAQVFTDENGKKTYTQGDFNEPWGGLMRLGADIAEMSGAMSDREYEQAAGMFVLALMRNIESTSGVYGFTKFTQAWTDSLRAGPIKGPERIQKYVNEATANFVPRFLTQIRQTQDPIMRETRTWLDTIQNRIPFVASGDLERLGIPGLEPSLNIWAEDIMYPIGGWFPYINPYLHSEGSDDTVKQLIDDLSFETGRDPRMPSDRWSKNVRLSPAQYNQYLRLMNKKDGGMTMKEEVLREIKLESFQIATAEGKMDLIQDIINMRKTFARMEMFDLHPTLEQQYYIDAEAPLRARDGLAPEANVLDPVNGFTKTLELFFGLDTSADSPPQ